MAQDAQPHLVLSDIRHDTKDEHSLALCLCSPCTTATSAGSSYALAQGLHQWPGTPPHIYSSRVIILRAGSIPPSLADVSAPRKGKQLSCRARMCQRAQHGPAGVSLAALFEQAGPQAARLSRRLEATQGLAPPAVPLVLLQHHAQGVILSQGVFRRPVRLLEGVGADQEVGTCSQHHIMGGKPALLRRGSRACMPRLCRGLRAAQP